MDIIVDQKPAGGGVGVDVDESRELRTDGDEVESMVGDEGAANEERGRLCIATSTGADTVLAIIRSIFSRQAMKVEQLKLYSTFATLE